MPFKMNPGKTLFVKYSIVKMRSYLLRNESEKFTKRLNKKSEHNKSYLNRPKFLKILKCMDTPLKTNVIKITFLLNFEIDFDFIKSHS